MFYLAARIAATFVFGLMALGCSASDGTYKDCARFKAALEKPAVMKQLETFYNEIPKKYEKTTLSRGSGRFPGIGVYTIPLTFDPSLIGLNPDAEARIGLDADGTLSDLVITDVPGSMFNFLVDDDIESFRRSTLGSPRGNRVGIICLRRD